MYVNLQELDETSTTVDETAESLPSSEPCKQEKEARTSKVELIVKNGVPTKASCSIYMFVLPLTGVAVQMRQGLQQSRFISRGVSLSHDPQKRSKHLSHRSLHNGGWINN